MAEDDSVILDASSDGEWLEASRLQQWAIQKLHALDVKGVPEGNTVGDIDIDMGGIDYLEAGILQVLLALDAELQKRSGRLRLLNVGASLREWFGYADALNLLEESSCAAESR